MADTHDDIEAIEKAVELFNNHEVDLTLHAGDIVSPFTVDAFKKLKSDFKAVYGNNEGDKFNLNRKLSEMDTELTDFLELTYDEKRIAVYHGQNPSLLDCVVKSQKYDIVVTAHTHTPEVTLEDNTLVVNPGEACGYLTGVKTVALVDTTQMKAEIVELK